EPFKFLCYPSQRGFQGLDVRPPLHVSRRAEHIIERLAGCGDQPVIREQFANQVVHGILKLFGPHILRMGALAAMLDRRGAMSVVPPSGRLASRRSMTVEGGPALIADDQAAEH